MGTEFDGVSWVDDSKVQAVGNSGAAFTVAAGVRYVTATLSANCTITLPAPTPGGEIDFELTQDGTGSRTATFTGKKAAGGAVAALSTAAASKDIVTARAYSGVAWVVTLKEKAVA